MVGVCFHHQGLLRCLVGLLPWDQLASLRLALKALDGVAGLLHQGLLHVLYQLHNYKVFESFMQSIQLTNIKCFYLHSNVQVLCHLINHCTIAAVLLLCLVTLQLCQHG